MDRLMRNSLTFFLLTVVWPSAVAAQLPTTEPGVVDRLAALEAEIRELRTAATQQYAPPPVVGLPQVDSVGFCETCTPDGVFGSQSKFPIVRMTGFFQADAGWVRQDAANIVAVGDVQDGADFRRARLAAGGDVAENVGYMVEFDFGFPGRPSFMDVWLEVRDLAWLNNFKVGQFRHPVGLDGLTSVKELTFLERGLPFAFLPFRQIGVMTSGSDEEAGTTWALSGFRFPTDAFGGQIGDSGGYGLATRLTALLIDRGDDAVLHVGGAYSLINPANNAVRYRSQPEFFTAETGGAAFVRGFVSSDVRRLV